LNFWCRSVRGTYGLATLPFSLWQIAMLAMLRSANYNGGMSKFKTVCDWRHIAILAGVGVAAGCAGGAISLSGANILAIAVCGLAAGSILFLANLALERIYPQC
jgi:hypothetical protein